MEKAPVNVVVAKKRKRGEKVFRFENFCEPGQPVLFSDAFQDNIKALLCFGYKEDVVGEAMQCWSFQLELHHYPCTVLRLFVAEEVVGMSRYRQCHYCRCVGWGHHMICNKRYHFVLPFKGTKPEMETLGSGLSGNGTKKEAKGSNPMGSQGLYLMHGVMHCNGYGHLITINGIDGGSEFISGHQILDFWDKICTALQVRKASITDAAKKWSMELRLIHGLAYNQPWFSNWGYILANGSYGATPQNYRNALSSLQSLPLFLLIPNLTLLISKYQTLCNHNLVTISHLFHFMLELHRRLPQNSPTEFNFNGIVTEPTCRWSRKRIEMAAQVIVGALKNFKSRWVTRQDVRDAARSYIGDTGLLDYVLKSLGNHIVGNHIVRRMVNPITKVLEYSLQDISCSVRLQIGKVQVMKDLLYLYKHLLNAESVMVVDAIRVILDAKHLVKEYPCCRVPTPDTMMCTVRVSSRELVPYEMVVIQNNATIGDLKREVEKKFKELYLGLRSFVADSIEGVSAKDSDSGVGVLVESTNDTVVVVEGKVEFSDDEEIYEGGGRVVDCHCGAKEEDGENIVCCDICEIWQHTRCAGISVDEDYEGPRLFLCSRCESNIVELQC